MLNWTAPSGRPANDWIGLFNSSGTRVWWQYTGGATSGRYTVSGMPRGNYQFKYFVSNTSIVAATSGTFRVK